MSFGDASAVYEVRNRNNVLFEIEMNAVLAHDLVDLCGHALVALIALNSKLVKLRLRLVKAFAGHGMERHVGRAGLVGMIGAAIFKGRTL